MSTLQELIEKGEDSGDFATAESLGLQEETTGTEEAGETEESETEATEEYRYELDDGSKFRTQAEALAHQRKLLRDAELAAAVAQAEANAYRQSTYQAAPVQQAPQQDPQQWENDFYADPKRAIEQAVQTAEQRMAAAQESRAADERIWRTFTDAHPELSGFRKEITDLIAGEAQLFTTIARTRGEKAAIDLAAQKMNEKLSKWAEAKKPKRDLGQARSVTPTATSQSITRKAQEEKPMSLKEQMAKLNEKRKR